MPEYTCHKNGMVPTSRGNVRFSHRIPTSILLFNGKYVCNDRRGIFIITEEVFRTYFEPVGLPGVPKRQKARQTIKTGSALRINRDKDNERKRIKYAAAKLTRQEFRVAHGGYRKNRFNDFTK